MKTWHNLKPSTKTLIHNLAVLGLCALVWQSSHSFSILWIIVFAGASGSSYRKADILKDVTIEKVKT